MDYMHATNYEKHDYTCLRHGLAGEVIKAII